MPEDCLDQRWVLQHLFGYLRLYGGQLDVASQEQAKGDGGQNLWGPDKLALWLTVALACCAIPQITVAPEDHTSDLSIKAGAPAITTYRDRL